MELFNTARVSARKAGLTKISIFRKTADVLKRTVLGYSLPLALPIQGFWLKGFGLWAYLTGTYERETTSYFNKTIRPGWTVIDVGADFGYFTLLFSKLVGKNGRVLAFEPSAQRRDGYLTGNIARNKFQDIVMLYPFGLSDTTGTKAYFEDTHSFYSHANTASTGQKEIRAFDEVFAKHAGTVDIVKIDVEGHEPAVIRGMRRTIEANYDIRIVFEVAPHLLKNAGTSPSELFDLLAGFGMRFFWLDESGETTPPLVPRGARRAVVKGKIHQRVMPPLI